MKRLELGINTPDMKKFAGQLEKLGIEVEIYQDGKPHSVSGRMCNYEVRIMENFEESRSSTTADDNWNYFLNNMSLTLYTVAQIIKSNKECLAIAESLTTERTLSECLDFAVESGVNIFMQTSHLWSSICPMKQPVVIKVFDLSKSRPTFEDICWALAFSWSFSSPCLIQVSRYNSLSALLLLAIITHKLPFLHRFVCVMLVDESEDAVVYTSNKDFEGKQSCELQTPENKLCNPFGSVANSVLVVFENADLESAAHACISAHLFANNRSLYAISHVLVQSSVKHLLINEIESIAKRSIHAGHYIDRNCNLVSERIHMNIIDQKMNVKVVENNDGSTSINFSVTNGTSSSAQIPALKIKQFTTPGGIYKKLSSFSFSYASIWTNSLMLGMECAQEIQCIPQILLNQEISPTSISFTWLNELKARLWSACEQIPTVNIPSLLLRQSPADTEIVSVIDYCSNDVHKTVEVFTQLGLSQQPLSIDASEQERSDVSRLLSTARNTANYRKFNCWSTWWSVLIKIASQMQFNSDELCSTLAACYECDHASIKSRFVCWSSEMLKFFANMHYREPLGNESTMADSCSFTTNHPRGLVAICVHNETDCGQLFALALLAAVHGNSVVLACHYRCLGLIHLGKVLHNCGIPAGMITLISGLSHQSFDMVRTAATVIWEISSDFEQSSYSRRNKLQWTFSCSPERLFKLTSLMCSCEKKQVIVPAEFKHGN